MTDGRTWHVRPLAEAMTAAVVAVALSASAALAGPHPVLTPTGSAQTCVTINVQSQTSAQEAAAAKYWTPKRLRESIPFTPAALARALARLTPAQRRTDDQAAPGEVQQTSCAAASSLAQSASAVPPVPSADTAQGDYLTTGYRTIGKFFYDVDGLPFNCTATAINDAKGNAARALVLTAAHCFAGVYDDVAYTSDNWAFAPGWHNNKDPYGLWQVKARYWPGPYRTSVCSTPRPGVRQCRYVFSGAYDYAAFIVKPINGHGVGAITGDDGWRAAMPKTEKVTIFGVPGSSPGMLEHTTDSRTVTTDGYLDRKAETPGFTDGASGGPWFYSYNARTQIGDILGDTGGYETGGDNPTGSPSFSPFWTTYFGGFIAGVAKHE
jgi:hypothetical protein